MLQRAAKPASAQTKTAGEQAIPSAHAAGKRPDDALRRKMEAPSPTDFSALRVPKRDRLNRKSNEQTASGADIPATQGKAWTGSETFPTIHPKSGTPKLGPTIQRIPKFVKDIGKGIATGISGLAGAIAGGFAGALTGSTVGLSAGASVGAVKTWKALTKNKSNWHKLYAWLPTLLAGAGLGVLGGLAGTIAGAGGGAIGSAVGLGGRVYDKLWSSNSNLGPIPKDPLLDPGIPGKFLGPSVIVNPDEEQVATANRGDRCMIYEIGSSPWVKVALGANGEGEQGFVDKRRVIASWSGRDTPWFEGRVTHQQTDQPLFRGTPSPDDIAQGTIGDCYLLSALSNVARVDPSYIRDKLIKDNGNGTVTAQFFRSSGNTYVPEKVTVRKSLLTYHRTLILLGKVTNQKKPLWPGMVEKAYTAWRGSKDLPSMINTPGNYRKLEGGGGNEVFTAIYGQLAREQDIQDGRQDSRSGFVYPWGVGAPTSRKRELKPIFTSAIKAILSGGANDQDNADYKKWEAYAEEHYSEIEGEVNTFNPTVPFVIRHLKAAGVRQGRFFDAVIVYCRQFMGGEGLKGMYTPAALAFYDKVKSLTDRKQHVTVGTRAWSTTGNVVTSSGKVKTTWFSGVLTVDDLFPNHAYEIVGVKQQKDVRYIKLRNPHGSKKVIGSAEFHIELSRAMHYMDSLYYLDRGKQQSEEQQSEELQSEELQSEELQSEELQSEEQQSQEQSSEGQKSKEEISEEM